MVMQCLAGVDKKSTMRLLGLLLFSAIFISSVAGRLRHSGSSRQMDSARIERLKQDILSNLGMRQAPVNAALPEYARNLIEATAARDDESQHFMAESANLLLTARRDEDSHFGTTINFRVKEADRNVRMNEIKLYFHIDMDNITFTTPSRDQEMWLALAMVVTINGNRSLHMIDDRFMINRHLIGWHSHSIPTSLIRQSMEQTAAGDISLQFQLTCINCDYSAHPIDASPANVPFLTLNGRRRERRGDAGACNGRCCMKELIVDFDALGWTWVLHPKQYIANYCTGSCENPTAAMTRNMESNGHILSAMLRLQSGGGSATCCVPREEVFHQMIYTDSDGVVRTNSNTIRTINSCKCY